MSKRILLLPAVENKIGYKKSTIYALKKAKQFPESIRLGLNRVGWLEEDIDAWIESKIEEAQKNV